MALFSRYTGVRKHPVMYSYNQYCFPGGSDSKESACKVGRPGFNPWVRKISWRRAWQPIQYSCLENPHGQRSLAGCSPWGRIESDATERLSTAQHMWTNIYIICLPWLPRLLVGPVRVIGDRQGERRRKAGSCIPRLPSLLPHGSALFRCGPLLTRSATPCPHLAFPAQGWL